MPAFGTMEQRRDRFSLPAQISRADPNPEKRAPQRPPPGSTVEHNLQENPDAAAVEHSGAPCNTVAHSGNNRFGAAQSWRGTNNPIVATYASTVTAHGLPNRPSDRVQSPASASQEGNLGGMCWTAAHFLIHWDSSEADGALEF